MAFVFPSPGCLLRCIFCPCLFYLTLHTLCCDLAFVSIPVLPNTRKQSPLGPFSHTDQEMGGLMPPVSTHQQDESSSDSSAAGSSQGGPGGCIAFPQHSKPKCHSVPLTRSVGPRAHLPPEPKHLQAFSCLQQSP